MSTSYFQLLDKRICLHTYIYETGLSVINLLRNLENLRANMYKVFDYDHETMEYATFFLFYFCFLKVVLVQTFHLFRCQNGSPQFLSVCLALEQKRCYSYRAEKHDPHMKPCSPPCAARNSLTSDPGSWVLLGLEPRGLLGLTASQRLLPRDHPSLWLARSVTSPPRGALLSLPLQHSLAG